MKKILFALLICVCMLFAFTACGNDASLSKPASDEAKAEATAEVTAMVTAEASDSDAEATEGFTKAKQGETLTFDWGEFTIGYFDHGECLVSVGGVQYYPSNNNDYIWLPLEFKNTSTDPIDLTGWWMQASFVMNDEYNYKAEGKQVDGDWTIQPLETRTLYAIAEVPKDVAESYESIAAQFAFNDGFREYNVFDDSLTDLDNVYEVKAIK